MKYKWFEFRCIFSLKVEKGEDQETSNGNSTTFYEEKMFCHHCDDSLAGHRYVLRDDHPYCIKCYENVFANNCDECGKIIGIDSKVSILKFFRKTYLDTFFYIIYDFYNFPRTFRTKRNTGMRHALCVLNVELHSWISSLDQKPIEFIVVLAMTPNSQHVAMAAMMCSGQVTSILQFK